MKVLETQSAVLSNYEVLVHLRDVQQRYAAHPDYEPRPAKNWKGENIILQGRLENLRRVVGDALRYLTADESPLTSPNATYSPEAFRMLIPRLAKYNLTKSELLMIFNIRPKDTNELDIIVEELETRLSPEEQEELLAVIAEVLGVEPLKVEEDMEIDEAET